MNKQKIWRIVSLVMVIFCFANWIYLRSESNEIKKEYKVLYEKEHLTVEDLDTKSDYKTCVTLGDENTDEIEVKYKKLYGIEHVTDYELDKDGGIEVNFLNGDPAKILIFDEDGNQRFYKEVSQLNFEPGESGKYSVYIVGNKFTGEIVFSTY